MNGNARQLIARLGLEPHPEGGYYREIFRSTMIVKPDDERTTRCAATTIYFLLAAGQHGAWHRVRSDEIWHFYDGAPLQLFTVPASIDRIETFTLDRERRVHVVPAGFWQAARTAGEYTLVGCTVAPGFEFADFTMLRGDATAREALQALDPQMIELV
jgi:predicted cupin superfamily sugar epimerase